MTLTSKHLPFQQSVFYLYHRHPSRLLSTYYMLLCCRAFALHQGHPLEKCARPHLTPPPPQLKSNRQSGIPLHSLFKVSSFLISAENSLGNTCLPFLSHSPLTIRTCFVKSFYFYTLLSEIPATLDGCFNLVVSWAYSARLTLRFAPEEAQTIQPQLQAEKSSKRPQNIRPKSFLSFSGLQQDLPPPAHLFCLF